MLPDIDCPFCRSSEVSMFMGRVKFSAVVSEEELCDRTRIALVGFICVKAHMFFVLDSDLAEMTAASAE
jgi:hypothetical protein